MKKSHFYSALFALVLANLFVYSCQKENAVTAPTATKEVAAEDRNLNVCPQITIINGVGLYICNVDNGPFSCAAPCPAGSSTSVPMDAVTTNPQTFPFANSNVFALYNPTQAAITVTIRFNCSGAGTDQVFVIPPNGGSLSFRVVPNANGCCQAVNPC